MHKRDQNRIVYALCVRGALDRLSDQLKNWYRRGLSGMAHPRRKKDGPEFWAWKAGNDKMKHQRSARI